MRIRNGVSLKEASLRGVKANKEKRQARMDEYNLDPSKCKFCSTVLSYKQRKNKFCNHSCSASFNNLGVTRNRNTVEWKKKECLNCGRITKNRKCCNNQCYSEYIKKKRRERITKNGSLIDYRSDKWYLIEIRGDVCEKCNYSKWNGEDIPLDTHHKDGDSDNNKLDNLLLICPNCHRQTDNHGSKNKSNSKRKQYRKKRYNQGLSY